MTALLPYLIAAPVLGYALRHALPATRSWTVPTISLLVAIVLAVAQQFELALTISLSGATFLGLDLFKPQRVTGRLQYRFCPNCATRLLERDFEGHTKLACPSCAFVFWNNPIVVGVALIPSEDGASIVMVERGVEPKKGMWCLPGGFAEPFEHPEQTAKREAGEEVKLEIVIDRLLAIRTAPGGNQVLVFYLAKPTSKLPTRGSDATKAQFVRLDALPDNIAFTTHIEVIEAWKQAWLAAQPN
jgi:8-oxo-dGTP diphosphatase